MEQTRPLVLLTPLTAWRLAGALVLCATVLAGDYNEGNPLGLPYPFEDRDGKVGYFSKQGKQVVVPRFRWRHADLFRGGAAIVVDEHGKYGYIAPDGHWVAEPRFEGACPFRAGRGAVKLGGKYGFIDTTGEFVIPPRFDSGGAFSEGICALLLGGRKCIIDDDGIVLHSCAFDDERGDWGIMAEYRDGLMRFRQGTKWGFLGPDGAIVIACTYDAVGDFSDGYSVVRRGDRVFVVDRSGSEAAHLNALLQRLEVLPARNARGEELLPRGDQTSDLPLECYLNPIQNQFSEGILVCHNRQDHFFIDKSGRIASRLDGSEHVYRCWPFSGGLSVVAAWPRPAEAEKAAAFDGVAPSVPEQLPTRLRPSEAVASGPAEPHAKPSYGLVDPTGKFVVECVLDCLVRGESGGYIFRAGSRWGVMDSAGQVTAEASFEDGRFLGDLARMVRGGTEIHWIDPSNGITVFKIE